MLDTLHVPLVDQDDNLLLLTFVNFLEQVLVSSINKDALEFWEENSQRLNIPVHEIWVQAFLRELRRLGVVKSDGGLRSLHSPHVVS